MNPDRVDITCGNCGRRFHVKRQVAEKTEAARCICGARLDLAAALESTSQKLGKYVLERRIAVGGMGEIFYGKIAGIEGFERIVAIKKMLPHLTEDRSFINMMVNEAKLTVQLNHPNIVQVLDLAKEGNEYFIAMEYVAGTNVGQMLELCHKKEVLLPVEVAVYVTMQVLRGLAYAHDLKGPDGEPMNVLHRDITPQNILVTPSAWAKITDFGIAKARNEISTTSPGMLKGKLGYIAPEQVRGREATQSVDIFCAGILLWESLAARRLFKGADEVDTFRLIAACQVPPLSDIREDVSAEIEAVIRKALAPSPEERYGSADEYYVALNQAISPRTADDLATASKRYFEEHPEFFANVIAVETTELSEGRTQELDPEKLASLPGITDIVSSSEPGDSKPTVSYSRRILTIAIATFLLLSVAVAAWALKGLRNRNTTYESENTPVARGLSAEEVQLAVDAEKQKLLETCYRTANSTFLEKDKLIALITVASTGGVAEVDVQLPVEKHKTEIDCIARVLSTLRFRRHPAPRFDTQVDLPPPSQFQPPKRKPKKRPPAPPPAPKRLNGQEVSKGVRVRQYQIAKCLRIWQDSKNARPAQLLSTMKINTLGKVTGVEFKPTPPEKIDRCLRQAFLKIRYRAIPVEMTAKVPLTVTTRSR